MGGKVVIIDSSDLFTPTFIKNLEKEGYKTILVPRFSDSLAHLGKDNNSFVIIRDKLLPPPGSKDMQKFLSTVENHFIVLLGSANQPLKLHEIEKRQIMEIKWLTNIGDYNIIYMVLTVERRSTHFSPD